MKITQVKKWIDLILASPTMLKDSAINAFTLLAIIETFMSVTMLSFDNVKDWWVRLFIIIIIYLALVLCVIVYNYLHTKSIIKILVRGIPVTIEQGDLFESDGWKVISFTDHYDTDVDNKRVNKSSINGVFIEKYVGRENIENLKQVILSDDDEAQTYFKKYMEDGEWKYPLGRIKLYKEDYMLLSFARIDSHNEVHTTRAEYEQCLRAMWKEIGRTYANIPISLPLLGSGVLRFDDWLEKIDKELLKCMICTLRTSGININQPITIVLMKDTLSKINLYELRGELQV